MLCNDPVDGTELSGKHRRKIELQKLLTSMLTRKFSFYCALSNKPHVHDVICSNNVASLWITWGVSAEIIQFHCKQLEVCRLRISNSTSNNLRCVTWECRTANIKANYKSEYFEVTFMHKPVILLCTRDQESTISDK